MQTPLGESFQSHAVKWLRLCKLNYDLLYVFEYVYYSSRLIMIHKRVLDERRFLMSKTLVEANLEPLRESRSESVPQR